MRSALVFVALAGATLSLSSSICRAEARAEGRGPAGKLKPGEGPVPDPALLEAHDVTLAEFEAIRAAIGAESWEEALELVRRRLEDEPGTAEASLGLVEARLLVRLDRDQGAMQVYRGLLEDPEVGKASRAELHALYVRRGQFDAADQLTEGADGPDGDPDLRRLRAFSRSMQGQYRESVALLTDPVFDGDETASMLRANALLSLGNRDAAEQLYITVVHDAEEPLVRQAACFGLGQIARLRGARATRVLQDEQAIGLARNLGLDQQLAVV